MMPVRIGSLVVIRGMAALLVLLAAVAAAVRLNQDSAPVITNSPPEPAKPVAPSIEAELLRCQTLGDAGAKDPGCLRSWAENRRRFLDAGHPPVSQPPVLRPLPGDR